MVIKKINICVYLTGTSCQHCTMHLNEIEVERNQLEDLRLWASDCHVSCNAEIRRQLNQARKHCNNLNTVDPQVMNSLWKQICHELRTQLCLTNACS